MQHQSVMRFDLAPSPSGHKAPSPEGSLGFECPNYLSVEKQTKIWKTSLNSRSFYFTLNLKLSQYVQ